METRITNHDHYSVAEVRSAESPISKLYITVDLHTTNSPHQQAVFAMFSDALLSGAGKYSRDEFLHEINKLGAEVKLSISEGKLTMTLESSAEKFTALTKLATLMLREPTFAESELDRIKTTVKNELHEEKEQSSARAHARLKNLMYATADRHHKDDPEVLQEALAQVGVNDFKAAHQTLFERFWHVSVGGSEKTIATATSFVKKLAPTALTDTAPTIKPTTYRPKLDLLNIPSRQNIDFSIGLPVPLDVRDEACVPLTFGVNVLAKYGGFAGRLMSTIREKEGLTYGIYGKLEGIHNNEPGYLRVFSFFAPDKAAHALKRTHEEISTWHQKGITQNELERFKTILHTQQTLLHDSMPRLLGNLHAYHCHNFSIEEIDAQRTRLLDLTRKEVNQSIAAYIDPQKLSVAGAGPTTAVQKELKDWFTSVS